MLYFIFIALFFLVAAFCLSSVSTAFRRIRRHQPKSQALDISKFFFYFKIQKFIFLKSDFDLLFFATSFAKYIFYFLSVTATVLFCVFTISSLITTILQLLVFLFLSIFMISLAPQLVTRNNPEKTIKILAPLVSFFLVLCLPLSYFFLRLSPLMIRDSDYDSKEHIKDKVIELIEETNTLEKLDAHHKELIESVITLKDRIVREVMIPRINVFSFDSSTTVSEASKMMSEKGYSRVPVYEENVDNIIGVLLYKDLLTCYQQENPSLIKKTIKSFIKNVIYTPETKKAIQLLQEFRTKQMHMAIVVDEYGGTEGIITIEDILEEIVGEISDEYDPEEEIMFSTESTGGWIVDAHMNILDIEDELSIKIPQEGDYDTLGGYIVHRAGEIPKAGLIIYHDKFKLEILKSTDRSIEKVKITKIN